VQGFARARWAHRARFGIYLDFWTKNQDNTLLLRRLTKPIETSLSRIVLSMIRLKKNLCLCDLCEREDYFRCFHSPRDSTRCDEFIDF